MTETGTKTWHELSEENYDLVEEIDGLTMRVNGLVRSNEELQHGRDTLATCITDVALELNLIDSRQDAVGTRLVGLMEEICDYAKHLRAELCE